MLSPAARLGRRRAGSDFGGRDAGGTGQLRAGFMGAAQIDHQIAGGDLRGGDEAVARGRFGRRVEAEAADAEGQRVDLHQPAQRRRLQPREDGKRTVDRIVTLGVAGSLAVTVLFTIAAPIFVVMYTQDWSVAQRQLAIGFAFGVIAWSGRFCIASSFLSYVAAADARGLRSVALACLSALLFSQGLDASGLIDLDRSIYRTETLHWFGPLLGGFAFGYGMILANGCGAGSLVRLGAGDLRALIVLIFLAIAAYMTMRGLTGVPRVLLERTLDPFLPAFGISSAGIDRIAADLTGTSVRVWRWISVAVLAAGLAVYAFSDAAFRGSPRHIWSGIAAGACIAAGWLATGMIGADPFDPAPLVSLTFVAPVANTLQYLMTYTGATVNFGIGTVGGVFLGSLAAALLRREFRLQFIDGDRDMINAMAGGVLMGIGGVFAFGCTFGNGLTGLSALGAGPLLGTAGIVAGGLIAARRQIGAVS